MLSFDDAGQPILIGESVDGREGIKVVDLSKVAVVIVVAVVNLL